MKPGLFVVLSVVCYSIAAVILEQKLTRFSGSLIVATVGATVCLLALITYALQRDAGTPIEFPKGALFLWLLAACVCWYFADAFYVGAYTNGGNLYTITTIGMLFPLVASAIRFVCTHELPTRYHIAAYILGCVMAGLVFYGNQQLVK